MSAIHQVHSEGLKNNYLKIQANWCSSINADSSTPKQNIKFHDNLMVKFQTKNNFLEISVISNNFVLPFSSAVD